jgi:hypothetical protein
MSPLVRLWICSTRKDICVYPHGGLLALVQCLGNPVSHEVHAGGTRQVTVGSPMRKLGGLLDPPKWPQADAWGWIVRHMPDRGPHNVQFV